MSAAESYASWVLDPANTHRTGRLIKLAAQRFFDDLKREDIYFDEVEANRICIFAENYCCLWEDKWRGKPVKLELWQKFALQNMYGWFVKSTGLRRFKKGYIQIAKKNAKALDINTPIPTPDGWRRMLDIQAGDFVFGDDGKATRVNFISELMERDSYEITFRGGDKIIASGDHLWRARNNKWRSEKGGRHYYYKIVDTNYIAENFLDKKGFPIIHIQNAKAVEYLHKNLLIPPYILGCWLGDGHSKSARVTFNALDSELVTNIQADGYSLTKGAKEKSSNAVTYKLGDYNELLSGLKAYNLVNNKHIPEVYLQSSIEQRFELLKGLMDTDGTATPRGQCIYCTIREEFAKDVLELITSLGFKATLTDKVSRCQTGAIGKAYYIGFFPDVPVFKLKRKLARQKEKVNHRSHHRTIIDVKPVGKRLVKCISVDNSSHLYLAGKHFIPTHNTTLGGGVIGNFHLFADERIKTPKIFVGANNEDQAKLCVNITGKVIEQSPALYEYVEDDSVRLFRYKENIVNIVHSERDGFIKALSKETGDRTSKTAGGKHGINPSLGIIDEYGMAQDDNLLNTIESAMAGREEPFVLIITTSGFYLQGPCHDKLRKIGIAVLEGTMTDDSYLALIYEIDPPTPGEITVDWLLANENVWEQANPNIDVSVFRTFLRDQLIAAKNEGGSKEVSVMTLNFNRWMESAEVFIPIDIWNTNSHESKIEDGEECYGGLWVGASGEISAFALIFPGEIVKIKMLFWMAEDSLKMNDTLRQYKEFIKVDPGNVVDNDIAVDWIVDMVGKYNMHSFCFPKPQENNSIIQDLIKLGYVGQSLSQGLASLAQPTDHWEKLIRSGKADHFNNPVLKWMNSNCMATRKEAGTKIDNNPKVYGISACINAVAQWDLIDAQGGKEIGIVFI